MAEGVGFEPTESFPSHDFESCAFDRTQPPFRLKYFRSVEMGYTTEIIAASLDDGDVDDP